MQETRQDKPRAGEEFSGTVVVLLDEQVPPGTDDTLLVHARRSGLDQLVEQLLALGNPPTERQVTSVRVQEVVEAERARLDGPFPPLRSLTRYWRGDVVEVGVRVEDAVARLRDVRGVALAYGELVVTEPSLIRRGAADPHGVRAGRVVPDRLLTPGDDPLFLDQRYLQPAPDSVDAVAAWGFRGGRGEGVRFVDVEEAWRWTHEDLDVLGVTLLCNTNRDGRNGFPGDHGNATLGVVAGVDNTVGVVGIAPRLDRVLVASHFKHMKGFGGTSAASAIVAGVAAVLQGMHRAAHGVPLGATALRALLADPAMGTPQRTPPDHPVGPMPDLRKLAAAIGAVPDGP